MSHKIITIARQFGSGGHEVGERLSKLLQIPLYDRSLVEMAAEKMGLSPITVEEVDEAALHSFLSSYLIDGSLCASMEDRISRIMDRYQIPRKEAASAVRHTDSQRRKYYENYTKQEWGSIESHQMLFNLSKLGVEKVVGVIAGIYKG